MADSLWQRVKSRLNLSEHTVGHDRAHLQGHHVGSVEDSEFRVVRIEPVGSSGTDITGGILNEEFLQELSGTEGADRFDKMRRSDPVLKMAISAVLNPIKSAKWEIEPVDDSEDAKMKADLVDHCIFNDLDKRWKILLHEILSMVIFGYSLFERTHKVVFDDPTFGTYIGFKDFGFRSQRTIERWNLEPVTGELISVEQWAFGDAQRMVTIPANFLTRFTLDQEGQNFEGISMLRSAYGPWLRKRTYQKLQAIGIEKFAVPTPILTVPKGLQDSTQFNNAVEILQKYISHQTNYLTIPEGWKLDIQGNDYDPAKVQTAIDSENKEMVNAFMANFLLLGQSGSGSYALSTDLSDFFLGGIVHIADLICEEFNDQIIPELIKLNFGPQPAYPKMKCSGIIDKAGKELSEVLKTFVDTKVIIPDDPLEKSMRKRYGFPEASDKGQREATPPPSPMFAEKKNILLAETARGLIIEASDDIVKTMEKNVKSIGLNLVDQYVTQWKKLPESQKIFAARKVKLKGKKEYEKELFEEFQKWSSKAINQAQKEVGIKLSEIKLAEFEDLDTKTRNRLKTESQLIVDTQLGDIETGTALVYNGALSETDSISIIEGDLKDEIDRQVGAPAVQTGSRNASAFIVNESRNAFFFTDDVIEQIQAFRFTNPAPVSPICQDLAGRVFKSDDPEASRFFPPLHHNSVITGTYIDTARGYVCIENVKVGDEVLTHENRYCTVTEFMDRFEDKHYFEIELENGKKIEITAEHPVLTKRGWLRVDELRLEDDIICREDITNET